MLPVDGAGGWGFSVAEGFAAESFGRTWQREVVCAFLPLSALLPFRGPEVTGTPQPTEGRVLQSEEMLGWIALFL